MKPIKGPEAVICFQLLGSEGCCKLSVPVPPAFSAVGMGPLPRRSLPEVTCQWTMLIKSDTAKQHRQPLGTHGNRKTSSCFPAESIYTTLVCFSISLCFFCCKAQRDLTATGRAEDPFVGHDLLRSVALFSLCCKSAAWLLSLVTRVWIVDEV